MGEESTLISFLTQNKDIYSLRMNNLGMRMLSRFMIG